LKVVPQIGCRPLEVRFDFAQPAFFLEQVPFWRAFMARPREARRQAFADAAFRTELQGLGPFVAGLSPAWDRLVLRMPATATTRRWQDQSIADVAAALDRTPVDTFCDLVLEDDLAGQWGIVMLNGNEDAVARLLRHPAGLLALSDAGAHVDTLCDQGFTSYLLGHWVRDLGRLSLEEAVRLLTAVPAERYGLRQRGRLAPGYAADLVLLDPARVAMRPTEMVYDLPKGQRRLLQRADGIVHVFVNGKPVVQGGSPVDNRPGRVLRGGI
jgi:N-acyl-D-aspartate/D-glutamate deacylase